MRLASVIASRYTRFAQTAVVTFENRSPLRSKTAQAMQQEAHVEVLKVSSKSSPNSVAGALAGVIREHGAVEIQTVGAGALNQAIKAIAIARGFVAPMGQDLVCTPAFADIEINGEERTAIRLLVEPRVSRHG